MTSTSDLLRPSGIVLYRNQVLYVADTYNHRILSVDVTSGNVLLKLTFSCINGYLSSGIAVTFAGSTLGYADGPGSSAQFRFPVGIDVDSSGTVFIADGENGTFSGSADVLCNNAIRIVSSAGEIDSILFYYSSDSYTFVSQAL